MRNAYQAPTNHIGKRFDSTDITIAMGLERQTHPLLKL